MKRQNQEKTKIASSNNAAANVFSDEDPAKLAIEIEIEEELQKLLEKVNALLIRNSISQRNFSALS
jgi:hypothetical protein